ncbi:MAG TPA: AI-2E family transporter [Candidatus Limnocylindria bacterium]|nr:AI-2E family transporter [Candidatus Limnocylindria bacterium]
MRAVWLAATLAALGALVVVFREVVLVFFAAAIFAVPLHQATRALATRLRIPDAAALVAVLVVAALATVAILWGWESVVAAQLAQLLATLPALTERLAERLRTDPWAAPLANLAPDPAMLFSGAASVLGGVRGFLGGTFSLLLDAAIVVFAAICFAAEPRTYVEGLLRLVPPARRARVDRALRDAGATIGLWLIARVISMATVGVLAGVGLQLLGIPYAMVLGVLAGILAFIPNIGSIASAIPALLLAAPSGWERVVAVAALYWLAHALDDFLVIPLAERRVVRLPPALTIAAQLVLGLSCGILGIMMAAPFVAVAIVLVRRLFVEDVVEREAAQSSETRAVLIR